MDLKKKIKLLIVDDEKDICTFQKTYFEKRNIETYVAYTGTKAIALAKSKKPDIAIIDIHMGKGMDGLKILQELLKVYPQCKCIMVSWDREKAQEAMKLGAADFLIKPAELKDLDKIVANISKKSKQ